MTSADWLLWWQFYLLEPRGDRRADHHAWSGEIPDWAGGEGKHDLTEATLEEGERMLEALKARRKQLAEA